MKYVKNFHENSVLDALLPCPVYGNLCVDVCLSIFVAVDKIAFYSYFSVSY